MKSKLTQWYAVGFMLALVLISSPVIRLLDLHAGG